MDKKNLKTPKTSLQIAQHCLPKRMKNKIVVNIGLGETLSFTAAGYHLLSFAASVPYFGLRRLFAEELACIYSKYSCICDRKAESSEIFSVRLSFGP